MFGFGRSKKDKIENMHSTVNRHLYELGSLKKELETHQGVIESLAKKYGLNLDNLNSWNATKMTAEWDRVPNLEDRCALVRAARDSAIVHQKLDELKKAVLAMLPAIQAASADARQRVVAKYGEGTAAIVEAVAEATSNVASKEIIRKGENGE